MHFMTSSLPLNSQGAVDKHVETINLPQMQPSIQFVSMPVMHMSATHAAAVLAL